MSKSSKRLRQRQARAAAEAARRRAEEKRQRRKQLVFGGATAVAVIATVATVLLVSRSGGAPGPKPTATPSDAAPPIEPGPGIACPSPAPPNPREYPGPHPMQIAFDTQTYQAVMKTSFGTMTIDLYAAEAPLNVNNFVVLSCDGYYNATPFHRLSLTPDLQLVQGGDPVGAAQGGPGTGSPGYTILDELTVAKRDGYKRGTVAIANTGAPHSGSGQFFIMIKDTIGLAPNYSVIGKVVDGIETLDRIAEVGASDPQGMGPPNQPVDLESVAIIEKPLGAGQETHDH